MCSSSTDRTIIVEGRIEGHTSAYASAFDKSFLSNLCRKGIPTQLSNRTISDALEPTLIDGTGNGIGVDGCCTSLEVRILAIEQLMPEAFTRLIGSQTTNMLAQLLEDEGTVGVRLGQHVEEFDGSQQSPSVGTSPVISRLVGQSFHIPMAIDTFLRNPHALDKVLIHSCGLVEILRLTRINASVCDCRDAHVHIVEPNGVALRTMTSESAVGQAILSVLHEIEVVLDNRRQILTLHSKLFILNGLHHRRTHRSAIVQGTGMEDLLHLGVLTLLLSFELRSDLADEIEARLHIIAVSLVASDLGSRQQGLVGDAPFVRTNAESTTFQCSVLLQGVRGLLVDIMENTVESRFHVFFVNLAVWNLVIGFQKVERGCHVVYFLFLLLLIGATGT